MAVRLDLVARGSMAAFDRNNPKARQDKWMLEVERAMLASTQPQAPAPFAPVGADAAPVSGPAPLTEDAAVASPDARLSATAGHPRVRHAGTDTSEHAPPAGMAGERDADAPEDAPGVDPASGLFAARPIGTAMPAGAAAGAATAGAVTDSPARGLSGFAPAAVQASTATATASGVGAVAASFPSPALVSGAPAPAGAASLLATALPGPVSAAAAVLQGLVAVPEAVGFMTSAAPAEDEPGPAGPARRPMPPPSARAEREPYAPSNVHVIDGADGIHAWVRDARMTPHQERAVAEAMIAGFIQQGAPVGSVTVNGRLRGARGDAERDAHATEHSLAEPPSSAAATTTIVRGAA